ASQALKHRSSNLRFGARHFPDAHFRELPIDKWLGVHHGTAQAKPRAIPDGRKTARVAVRRDHGTVEEELHPVAAGDGSQMIPFVGPDRAWHAHAPDAPLSLGNEIVHPAIQRRLDTRIMVL